MSNELFNRTASLKIGSASSGLGAALNSLNSKVFSGFRISFDIEKTSESNPNTAKISIYNLSAKSRAELEKTGLIMSLEVGYIGLDFGSTIISQIFIGDVKLAKSERKGADIITTLEAGDSETAIRETHIDQSFADYTTTPTVIGTLAKKLGVAVGTVMPGLAGIFESGLSLTGLVSDNLDVLTQKAGLEWNVTDGELNILDPKLPTTEPAVLVSPNTGLVGIPNKREEGVEFTSLLNPLIKPGRAISLVSNSISGVFKPRKCTYKGDTHSGEWLVTVEAI